uniref:SGNH domain-containing protein n=1 Tax=Steinernema glaseri TaxID=37863 RepID=A0A1I7YCT7_9BILA
MRRYVVTTTVCGCFYCFGMSSISANAWRIRFQGYVTASRLERRSVQSSSESIEIDPMRQWNQIHTTHIENAFSNKKNFACPRMKDRFHTDIMTEFVHKDLEGVSHGMGTMDILPDHQFNVAQTGATTNDMPSQAEMLVKRIHNFYDDGEYNDKWILIMITIGTEEICKDCDTPNIDQLRRAIMILKRNLPKALIVLIGPIHVAKSSHLTYNLLKPRCTCMQSMSNFALRELQQKWKDLFFTLEREFAQRNYPTFGLLTLPSLSIASRHPEQLFIVEKPLLNRKGHTYAAKWLWNRLITGPKYNISRAHLSTDSYFCPSLTCPYFRTIANWEQCVVMTNDDHERLVQNSPVTPETILKPLSSRQEFMQRNIVFVIVALVFLSTLVVVVFAAGFYVHGLKATKGRFDMIQGV